MRARERDEGGEEQGDKRRHQGCSCQLRDVHGQYIRSTVKIKNKIVWIEYFGTHAHKPTLMHTLDLCNYQQGDEEGKNLHVLYCRKQRMFCFWLIQSQTTSSHIFMNTLSTKCRENLLKVHTHPFSTSSHSSLVIMKCLRHALVKIKTFKIFLF